MDTSPARPRRRTVVLGMVAAAAAACTSDAEPSTQDVPVEPDAQLADLAAERELVAAYDATITALPSLRDRLTPIRDHHAEHANSLEEAVGEQEASATPSPTGSTGPPADPAAAVTALREAERAAANARTASCLSASADRAALLGSIAACEASHEVLLT